MLHLSVKWDQLQDCSSVPLDNGGGCGNLSINMPLIYLGYSSFSGGKVYVIRLDPHIFHWSLVIRNCFIIIFNYKIPKILSDKFHPSKRVVGENAVIQADGLLKNNYF